VSAAINAASAVTFGNVRPNLRQQERKKHERRSRRHDGRWDVDIPGQKRGRLLARAPVLNVVHPLQERLEGTFNAVQPPFNHCELSGFLLGCPQDSIGLENFFDERMAHDVFRRKLYDLNARDVF